MTLSELKKCIELAETKYRENPTLQKLVNTAGGAGIGYWLGSIRLGKDPNSRLRGYLFSRDKGSSRNIGALAGALAGLHAPTLSKVEKQEKKAEFSWDKVTDEIKRLRDVFNRQDSTTKALLATGGGALGGVALSSLFGGGAGRGAMLGAMAGGASQVDWRKVLKELTAAHASRANI